MFSKLYRPQNGIQVDYCLIVAPSYHHTAALIDELVAEVQLDFPDLSRELIFVKFYKDSDCKGYMGVEFRPTSFVPETYAVINLLPTPYN